MRSSLRYLSLACAVGIAAACSSDPSATNPGGPIDAGSSDRDASNASDSSDANAVITTDGGHDAGVDAAAQGALYAFVGSDDNKVRAYAVDQTTGAWTKTDELDGGTSPFSLAVDPARRRVVGIHAQGGGSVRSFAFDPVTGKLTPINSKSAGGSGTLGTTHVSFHPTGNWVFAANYTAGTASVLPIDAAGMLGDATDTKSTGERSHWAGTNPSGTHVFVPAVGANAIAQFVLDTTTGKLTANGTVSPPSGAGPRHLAFHPSEQWAYAINETATTMTTLDFDKTTGKLTAKQTISARPLGESTGNASGAEVYAHPSGKHVYASTRAYNSIAHFSVNAADGTLTRVANVQVGDQPTSFGVSPEGDLLFAGIVAENHVVGFRIDRATGALTSLGKTVDVPYPVFVGLARVP